MMRFKSAVAALLISAVGYVIAPEAWDHYQFTRRSPIAANLPRDFEAANDEFAARITAQFPIGSPERALIETLEAQGFGPPQVYHDKDIVRHGMTLEPEPTGFRVCLPRWHVGWTSDTGSLSTVRGHYSASCL